MSGQPNQTPLDPAKFRQQYLSNLNLQVANNDLNFQANHIFKKTGIPQQPLDTRTQEEIFRDIQGLKTGLYGKLSSLMMSGQGATDVLNQLSDNEIKYLASSFPKLESILKPKYALGIPPLVFIDTLRRYIAAEERNRGIDDGLQQVQGEQILLNTNLLVNNLVNRADLAALHTEIEALKAGSIRLRQSILAQINQLQSLLPDFQEIEARNRNNNAILQEQVTNLINDALKDVPTKAELQQSINRLQVSVRTRDVDGINAQLTEITNKLATSADLKEDLEIIKSLIGSSTQELRGVVERKANYIPFSELKKKDVRSIQTYYRHLLDIPELKSIMLTIMPNPSQWTSGSKAELLDVYEQIEDSVREHANSPSAAAASPPSTPGGGGKSSRVKGKGVGRPRTRNYEGSTRPKRSDHLTHEDVDWKQGIPVVPRFYPFGRYIINKKKLDDNIVSLKTRAGGYLSKFKSTKVSPNLGGIFRTILGNGIPKYEDLEQLSPEEKEYLHKVAMRN